MSFSRRSGFPALLIAALLLAACDTSGNTQKQPQLQMSTQAVAGSRAVVASEDTVVFEPVSQQEAPCLSPRDCEGLPAISVEAGRGQLRIEGGYFLSPHGVGTLSGEVEKMENQIEIRVGLPEDDEGGPDVLDPFLYEARVANLEAGTYRVRVVHRNDALRAPAGDGSYRTIAADRTVTVE